MHVIFIAPHFPANQRSFVRALKEIGCRVSGIIDSPYQYVDSEVKSYLDDYEEVPSVTSLKAVTDAVQKIQKRGPWVHHLEAAVEAHMFVCARARELCGIPGLPYSVVERCRDKVIMKKFLRDRGFPVARDAAVNNAKEAIEGAKQVGFPLILKPRSGAGASGTYRVNNAADLNYAIKHSNLDKYDQDCTMEQFLEGHEGFYDTITINGNVIFESISHYYPNVLTAMRTRDVAAQICVTNRVEWPSYSELRVFGQKVIKALGITTAPTHMEWFFGNEGLKFSEIACRPPGVSVWDLFSAINNVDIYKMWSNAICHGTVHQRPSRKFAGGMLSLRPNKDGRVAGYTGIEEVQKKYGQYVIKAYMPPQGSSTQPIEAGYRANAWMFVRHPDYDQLRRIMDDIGKTIKMWAD
ncbi:MAG: ATP-grasp domain-containing protein [Myxococcota bacterium]|nr:ATP-grasp domain-containing protein [Myxococcota bacterium]